MKSQDDGNNGRMIFNSLWIFQRKLWVSTWLCRLYFLDCQSRNRCKAWLCVINTFSNIILYIFFLRYIVFEWLDWWNIKKSIHQISWLIHGFLSICYICSWWMGSWVKSDGYYITMLCSFATKECVLWGTSFSNPCLGKYHIVSFSRLAGDGAYSNPVCLVVRLNTQGQNPASRPKSDTWFKLYLQNTCVKYIGLGLLMRQNTRHAHFTL